MSSDENWRGRLKRWSESHQGRRGGLDKALREVEQVRRDLEAAQRAQTEGSRLVEHGRSLHDAIHRDRDRERAKRSGKRPLDTAAIAAAAVAIADAQGVEEVSMRKVAAVLGAGTMSLYHYVRTKEDLLAAMDDLIMAEILVAPAALKGGWRQAMSVVARHTRDAYRRHPWALTIQSAADAPGINSLRHVEQSLAGLGETNLSFEDKMTMLVIVDDYVFGHSLRAMGIPEGQVEETAQALGRVAEYMEKHLSEADFPALRAAVGEGTVADLVQNMAKSFHPEEWFETGLEVVLDGLGRRFKLD